MTEKPPEGLKLSLFEHLGELRDRLKRSVLAVLVLGTLSLAFAKELFHVLVAPILAALPEGERTLVQTSAVEELNTLIKVGLYAGLFFSAPVILAQLWGFVSPGLFAAERKMAAPFVLAGTLCFVGGAAFAYFAVLPPAFEFLLKPEETRDQRVVLLRAKGRIEDAGRLFKVGDLPGAERLVALGEGDLGGLPAASEADAAALVARANALDPLLDAADRAVARSGQGALALQESIAARERARSAALAGATTDAGRELAAAEGKLRQSVQEAVGGEAGANAALLLERWDGLRSRFVAASRGVELADWTKPMLSMKEQLNLVLVLLLAFGAIFEIPVVFALLAALGIIDGHELARVRRYAIVVNVIVAAILTPTGDPLNLALMAGPMILCYEIGIIAAKLISRRRRARIAAAAA